MSQRVLPLLGALAWGHRPVVQLCNCWDFVGKPWSEKVRAQQGSGPLLSLSLLLVIPDPGPSVAWVLPLSVPWGAKKEAGLQSRVSSSLEAGLRVEQGDTPGQPEHRDRGIQGHPAKQGCGRARSLRPEVGGHAGLLSGIQCPLSPLLAGGGASSRDPGLPGVGVQGPSTPTLPGGFLCPNHNGGAGWSQPGAAA